MNYSSLLNYYQTNHEITSDRSNKYSLHEIESMYPFERDLYIDLLVADSRSTDTFEAPTE